ncbi:MAG: LON peptidase substrate-binding domain-containing protein, partial [Cycloclasticus sp.]|nr:LON peptidase substrate-binding domain-containing protein [Cycloclasticus sp.]
MSEKENLSNLPVLPLRDVVVYPHMVLPLFVGRDRSIQSIDLAMGDNKKIVLIAQKDPDHDDPAVDDLYQVGTLATILQLLKLPDGTVKVLVEGEQRVKIDKIILDEKKFTADVSILEDVLDLKDQELDVLVRTVSSAFENYVKLNKKVPPEVLTSLSGIDGAGRLADTMSAHMVQKVEEKQRTLETSNIRERLEHLMLLMEGEVDILEMEKQIRSRVKQQMEKNQREYYLSEQMKAIQKELGDMDDASNEIDELEQKINAAGMSKEAKEKAESELN